MQSLRKCSGWSLHHLDIKTFQVGEEGGKEQTEEGLQPNNTRDQTQSKVKRERESVCACMYAGLN
jgi:hypothetical protein